MAAEPAPKKLRYDAKLMAEHPWMESMMGVVADSAGSGGSGGAGGGGGGGGVGKVIEEVDSEDEDARLEELFKELDAKRVDAAAVESETVAFRVKLLCGNWLIFTKGKAADAWQGRACFKDAEIFCTQYALQKTARFEITLYGDKGAAIFARAWCHRMEHFYNIWVASDAAYVFVDEDVASYVEPAEFTELVGTLEGKAAARAVAVRAIRPRA